MIFIPSLMKMFCLMVQELSGAHTHLQSICEALLLCGRWKGRQLTVKLLMLEIGSRTLFLIVGNLNVQCCFRHFVLM
jgi:hypothetical protein